MFQVYLWIDGESFDAASFGRDAKLTGTVETRKRVANHAVERFGAYWRSEVRATSSDDPEGELAELISRYKGEIQRARASNATRIVGQIVAEYESVDDLRGFHFSVETMRFFADLGVAVDVDVVRGL